MNSIGCKVVLTENLKRRGGKRQKGGFPVHSLACPHYDHTHQVAITLSSPLEGRGPDRGEQVGCTGGSNSKWVHHTQYIRLDHEDA